MKHRRTMTSIGAMSMSPPILLRSSVCELKSSTSCPNRTLCLSKTWPVEQSQARHYRFESSRTMHGTARLLETCSFDHRMKASHHTHLNSPSSMHHISKPMTMHSIRNVSSSSTMLLAKSSSVEHDTLAKSRNRFSRS